MLKPEEKAYCQALLALKHKDYTAALTYFDQAEPAFSGNKEFHLYRETTRLLLVVKDRLTEFENEDNVNIKEAVSHGQKTELRG